MPLLVLAIAVPALAAPLDDQAIEQIRQQSDGFKIGHGLILKPELSVSAVQDSNIYALPNHPKDDTIWLVTPSVELTSLWKRHRFRLSAGSVSGRYNQYHKEDFDDYWLKMDGQYDYSDTGYLFAGGGISRDHEDRGSPDAVFVGDKPTVYDSRHAHAGVSQAWGRLNARFGGTVERLDYRDAGNLDNDDRDRRVTGAGLRLSWTFSPKLVGYAEGIGDWRQYRKQPDNYGFDRDSKGYRAGLGLQARLSNRTRMEAYAGALVQSYEDNRFTRVSKFDYSASLTSLLTPAMSVKFLLSRSLEETTLPYSEGYLYTSLSGELNQYVSARLSVRGGAAASDGDYLGTDREDRFYTAWFALSYDLTPRWYVSAEYRINTRDSNIREVIDNSANLQSTADYSRRQLFLTVGARLYPVSAWPEGKAQAADFSGGGIDLSGLYVGLGYGHEVLDAGVDGQRSHQAGVDRGEIAAARSIGSLFAGYGHLFGDFYLGVELEGDRSGAEMDHTNSRATSRDYSLNKVWSEAALLVAGYRLEGGTLVYARGGVARADFDMHFVFNDQPSVFIKDTYQSRGVRGGVGADLRAAGHLFVRLDYSFTDYEHYTVALGGETQKFDPTTGAFRLGLGWRFGADAPAVLDRKPLASGFYAGFEAGYGDLLSDVKGDLTTGESTGGQTTSRLAGNFGAHNGYTGGVFVGYRYAFARNWMVALEGELEDSSSDWSRQRSPGGRQFSVDKHDTTGLALRVGYRLDDGSVLYVRGGPVRTRFDTTWLKGDDPANYVDRDDRVSGERYGVGADMPLGQRLFLRMEYTFTRYDDYVFVTSQGSADTVNFDNAESMFRFGIGAVF